LAHLFVCPFDAWSKNVMFKIDTAQTVAMLVTLGVLSWACSPASADVRVEGQVQAGAAPVTCPHGFKDAAADALSTTNALGHCGGLVPKPLIFECPLF
jgi:hypothetical protein